VNSPQALVAGDFNADGHSDLAIADAGSYDDLTGASIPGDVTVLLGRGDGTFQDPVRVATVNSPQALVAGDFNTDGRTDLAAADDFSGGITVLLGRGDGTFLDQVRVAAGNYPQALVAGDFNADGRTDLVTAIVGAYDSLTGASTPGDV